MSGSSSELDKVEWVDNPIDPKSKLPMKVGAPDRDLTGVHGMVMVEAAYLRHAGNISEVHGRLKEAWGEICQKMFDRFELDYGDFFEIGEKYGLLRKEVFDPAVHGEHFDGYPGDPIYFNALQEVKNATANDND